MTHDSTNTPVNTGVGSWCCIACGETLRHHAGGGKCLWSSGTFELRSPMTTEAHKALIKDYVRKFLPSKEST